MYKELHQLDSEELERLSNLIETDAASMCTALFPDHAPGKRSVLKEVAQWAVNRKVVLDNHHRQNPHIAMIFEKVCYRIWQKLPGYAKSLKVDAGAIAAKSMENAQPVAGSSKKCWVLSSPSE